MNRCMSATAKSAGNRKRHHQPLFRLEDTEGAREKLFRTEDRRYIKQLLNVF